MCSHRVLFLAAKKIGAGALALGLALPGAQAGAIPVIDIANLRDNHLTAIEVAAQRLKQIQQYSTQLDQYENMLQNTAAPPVYLWDEAMATLRALQAAIDGLAPLRAQVGGLDAYLAQFQDLERYRASPCLAQAPCSSHATAQARDAQERFGSQVRKTTNDALLKGLYQQADALPHDAQQLQHLQERAQKARGQMQALGFANQLTSHQAHQLLQLRVLLVAQQTAEAARQQVLADREARQLAAHDVSTARRITPTLQPTRWLPIRP